MSNIIKYATDLSNITRDLNKAQHTLRKYGPLIGTVGGCVGLVVTAKLAYDAKGKVTNITEKYEQKLADGEVIKKTDMFLEYGVALAPAIITGTLSLASIAGSYHVLTNRLHIVNMALTAARKENASLKEQLLRENPDAVTAPVEEYKLEKDPNDKDKLIATEVVRRRGDLSTGCWFDASNEYMSDAPDYNLAWIANAAEQLSSRQTRGEYIKVTDIYSALDIPLTSDEKMSLYGFVFSPNDFLTLDTVVVHTSDEFGNSNPIPYVEWPTPRYDLDLIDN